MYKIIQTVKRKLGFFVGVIIVFCAGFVIARVTISGDDIFRLGNSKLEYKDLVPLSQQLDIKYVEGKMVSVNDDQIKVELPSGKNFDVMIDNNTTIILRTPKDKVAFQKEIEAFKIKNESLSKTSSSSTQNINTLPVPYESQTIVVSEIKSGDRLRIISTENFIGKTFVVANAIDVMRESNK